MDDECACLPGFSTRQGESEVHDVMCTLMEMGWGAPRPQGLPFRFFSESRRLPETKFRPKFANSERKENSNSKNEISVISTEIR